MIEYLMIFAASIAVFWRAVFLGLVPDDIMMHPDAQHYKQLWRKKEISFIRMLWYVLQGAGLFKSYKLDHAFSVLVHTVNSCLILKISGLFPAALLYLLSPINNQVALWLNGRRYGITIFCVLASCVFWPAAPLLYAFAAWLHVSGVVAPFLLLATPYWFLVPVAGAIFGVVGFKRIVSTTKARMEQYPKGTELFKVHPKKLIFYVKHIGYYAQIILFPFKPRMYHEFHFYFPRHQWAIDKAYRFDWDFARGAAVCLWLAFEIVVNQSFWAFWFVLFISQYAGIFTTTMNVADRYCSLAGIGLLVLLAQKLALLPAPFDSMALVAFVASYVVIYEPLLSYAYKRFDNFLLYHTHIEPGGSRQRIHLAQLHLKNEDAFSAFYILKQGLQKNPDDFDMLLMMAITATQLGFPKEVIQLVERAEKHLPLNDEAAAIKELNALRENAQSVIEHHKKAFEAQAKRQALAREKARQLAGAR